MASLLSLLRSGEINRNNLLPIDLQEVEKPNDWVKITALVIAIITGLVAGFAGMTIAGFFPVAIFGGWEGAWFTIFATGIAAFAAGATVFYRHKVVNPD